MSAGVPVALPGIDGRRAVVELGLLQRFMNWLMGTGVPLPNPVTRDGSKGYSVDQVIDILKVDRMTPGSREAEKFRQGSSRMLQDSMEPVARHGLERLHAWEPRLFGGTLVRRAMVPIIGTSKSDRPLWVRLVRNAAGVALVGAGVYLGHCLPDWDFDVFGPGGHRNFLFHSAIPVLAAYRIHTWLRRKFPASDESLRALCYKALGMFIGGVALGASTHLLLDATVQGSKAVIFPLTASLVNETLVDDNIYLGLGSLVSLYVAFKEFEYCLGADHFLIKMARPYLDETEDSAERAWKAVTKVFELLKDGLRNLCPSLNHSFGSRRFRQVDPKEG